ncbi:MAG: EVE domain-containing protein [Bacteroidia bacterium]
METRKYWIAVVSKEHAMRGVDGNFMQVCHGKEAPLKRIKPNDWLIVYSPKLKMEEEQKCQSFTAIGRTMNDTVYQFQMTSTFNPYRKDIEFYNCKETSILPLINELEFIPNKSKWGYPFRFGFFEIKEKDFNLIVSKMLPDEIQ